MRLRLRRRPKRVICADCYGMPHRVQGERCPSCNLKAVLAPEPPPPSTPPVDPPAPAVAAALAAIAELIAEPERWCQGCSARDAQGRPTVPGSVGAARLSAFGAFALLRFDGRLSNADALRLWLVLDGATPDGRRFARWHDDQRTTHAEVLALLKRARGEP